MGHGVVVLEPGPAHADARGEGVELLLAVGDEVAGGAETPAVVEERVDVDAHERVYPGE